MLRVSEKWQVLEGYGFGLHHPIMLGEIELSQNLVFKTEHQQEVFSQLLKTCGPLPKTFKPPSNATEICSWLLEWAHHLQQVCNIPVFELAIVGQVVRSQNVLKIEIVAPYSHPRATLDSIKWVVNTASSVACMTSPSELDAVINHASRNLLDLREKMTAFSARGINIRKILSVSIEHEIAFQPLFDDIYTFGQGRKSRWLKSTFTDLTSYLGSITASRKDATSEILARHGLPVARHFAAKNEEEAVKHASCLGYPVVVKPADLEGGKGVHAGLISEEKVRQCYRDAVRHSRLILVEKFHEGRDYRLTVLNGNLIKAVERIPGGVTGDGEHNVQELLQLAEASPESQRRILERGESLLSLDQEAQDLLLEAGLTADSIIGADRFIKLRRRANVSTGGTTRLVMDQVHPANRKLAERAADVMRLDMAGIDLLIPDISKSWLETGAIICEVNAQPQLGENNIPGLYSQFMFSLVDGNGHIPIALILAHGRAADEIQIWTAAFTQNASGSVVINDGVMYLDGEQISHGKQSFTDLAKAAQNCRQAERILFIATPRDHIDQGLPIVIIDTAVILPGFWREDTDPDMTRWFSKFIAPHLRGAVLLAPEDTLGQELRNEIPVDRCFHLAEEDAGTQVGHFLAEHGQKVYSDW